MTYQQRVAHLAKTTEISPAYVRLLHQFYGTYVQAAKSNQVETHVYEQLLEQFLELIEEQTRQPYLFEPYHQHLTQPFNYYQFGVDFIRPLVILQESTILHPENLVQISQQLKKGDNVILFANHQTELDPQVISLLLEKNYPQIAEDMIFVAGHRVVSDPMAIPFSKGRNLLCIYSKKYIEGDAEKKEERRTHNQRTMLKMSELLSEGGKCIYVAPSGGRDRIDAKGVVQVAPFDPQSIEMFWLMTQRAEHPTHFYPLAMATYNLLPPPEGINKELGEARHTKATAVHLAFGAEIGMENFPADAKLDKRQKRAARAEFIWKQVCEDYKRMD